MIDYTYNFIVKVTTGCPGNCRCCTNRRINFKDKTTGELFDIAVFRSICKKISEIGGRYICLSGGEPTFVDCLEDYISIAHEFGLVTRINTNGWDLTRDRLKVFLELGLDQIVLSVYGTDREQIVKTRGNSKIYDRCIRALDAISELKKEYRFTLIIQTILMKDTYMQLPQILEIALTHGADRLWPSYLEDAINLPDIRMTGEDVKVFKDTIVPMMSDVIRNTDIEEEVKNRIISDIGNLYQKDYSDGVYHNDVIDCPWPGHHFTFYPNGVIDPCPGHEYFKSEKQIKVDYAHIDEFLTEKNLSRFCNDRFDYCKYCPHGSYVDIPLNKHVIHEHMGREGRMGE